MKRENKSVLFVMRTYLSSFENRLRLLVAAGLLGMLLLLYGQGADKSDTKAANETTQENFVPNTEERMCAILSKVDGIGKVDIMITLDSKGQTVYATNEKRTTEAVAAYADGNLSQREENGDFEQSYLLVDSGGRRTPLELTREEPTIRGVLVVCEGAGDPVVRERVLKAVTTALGVGANQVCILKSE